MIARILLATIVFGFLGFALFQLLNFLFGQESFQGKEGKVTRKIKRNIEGISPTTVNIIISIIVIISFVILLIRI